MTRIVINDEYSDAFVPKARATGNPPINNVPQK